MEIFIVSIVVAFIALLAGVGILGTGILIGKKGAIMTPAEFEKLGPAGRKERAFLERNDDCWWF